MTYFQIIIIFFALFVLVRVLVRYIQKTISFKEWLFWTILWIASGVAAALPATTDQLAFTLGLETGRGVDLAVYSSIPVLFYIIFRLYTRLDQMEKNITKIVRAIAVKDNLKD